MGTQSNGAQPFKQWYLKKYGVDLGKKGKKGKADAKSKDADDEKAEKRSRHVVAKQKYRDSKQKLDPAVEEQFQSGRMLACIASAALPRSHAGMHRIATWAERPMRRV